ncbi:MAG TPA: hypothetical protein VMF03_06505 [Steroidobacteraceae bacterium]|nr:hypothetical protein [Steroidobacteraceae bacterium]
MAGRNCAASDALSPAPAPTARIREPGLTLGVSAVEELDPENNPFMCAEEPTMPALLPGSLMGGAC